MSELTENKVLLQIHGGKGDNRIRIIKGNPLARYIYRHNRQQHRQKLTHTITDSRACHFVFEELQRRRRLLKSRRNIKKASADPIEDAAAAKKKPFMPYAKPHNVIAVVWPMKGGKQTRTADEQSQPLYHGPRGANKHKPTIAPRASQPIGRLLSF